MGRGLVFNLGYGHMAKPAVILLFTFLYLCDSSSGGNMIRSTTIRPGPFNTADIASIKLFCFEKNNALMPALFVETQGSFTSRGSDLLYINGSWTDLKEHGDLLNVFVKDGQLYIAHHKFKSDEIVIQKVQQNGELVGAIGIKGDLAEYFAPGAIKNVIPVQERNNSYYLVASRYVFPANPVEFLFDFVSGGHGIYYVKPFLAEVQDGKIGKPQKLRYGGKIDETYYIKQVVQSGDLVHFLGFRQQEVRAWGKPEGKFTPVILHHTAYDLKKKKVTQTNPIYTDTPRLEKDTGINYFYGDISIDALDNNVFVAFSWKKRKFSTEEYYIESIFYWDYSQGKAGKTEKIADGFLPMVKADSLGNAHLLYVNHKANLMHKVKRNGIWQKDDVLVDRVDTKPYIENIAAAFDKGNNLHVVYPSDGKLIHAIIKVD